MKWIYGLMIVGLASCAGEARKEAALPVHKATERVKEAWQKVVKPVEIEVVGRTQEELETIGSLGVWFEGIDGGTAQEFLFDGEVFKPSKPILADSTITPYVFFPYSSGLSHGDTIAVSHPIGPRLIGVNPIVNQTNDKIKVKIELNDITALLRIRLQSDNMEDVIDGLGIKGACIQTDAVIHEFGKRWGETRGTNLIVSQHTDCMLNNGWTHDYHLIPTEQTQDIVIIVEINGKKHNVSTTLPPLRMGSITELRLNFIGGKLTVGSSWVDSKHPFERPVVNNVDSVKVGYFLQRDGRISTSLNDKSLAWIIETDGKHGKAVALQDNNDCNWFDRKCFQTGKDFPTVDGKLREGYFQMNKFEENYIVYSPRVKYPGVCAFGYDNGAALTRAILAHADDGSFKNFCDKRVLATGYIPSLTEMVRLAFFLKENEGELPNFFSCPEGTYATSSESGEDTFYSIDFDDWFITAYNSKEHDNCKTRLFYLF